MARDLHELLAELFDDLNALRTLLDEAQVPFAEVTTTGALIDRWSDALRVAQKHHKLDTLIAQACERLPERADEFKQAQAAYLQRVASTPKPTLQTAAPIRSPTRSAQRRTSQAVLVALIGAAGLVLAAVIAGIIPVLFPPIAEPTLPPPAAPFVTSTPSATPLPTPTATPSPKIILMDSVAHQLVYVPTSQHNTDDIREILDDILPISSMTSEVINANWHDEEVIVGQNPSLIIIHASAFLANLDNYTYEIAVDADKKSRNFLQLVAKETSSKVLIYSRGFCGDSIDTYEKEYRLRFPTLKDRLALFPVCKPDTWKNSEIRFDLRKIVKEMLDLK